NQWPQLCKERREILRRRLRRVDQLRQVVQRGVEVDEGRVRLAQRGRQDRERLVERHVLVADRARGGVGVAHERREVVTQARNRGGDAGGVPDEARELRLVPRELRRHERGGRERRREVLEALVRVDALAVKLRGGALDQLLEAAPLLRVERVEELIEVDGR